MEANAAATQDDFSRLREQGARVYSALELAAALGITERSVRRRADEDGWPYRDGISRGGRRKLYFLEALPEEVGGAVRSWESRREMEAMQRLREEEVAARITAAPQAAQLPEKERRVAWARAAVLSAAENFCLRTASGDARPTSKTANWQEFFGRLNSCLQAIHNPPRPPFRKGGSEKIPPNPPLIKGGVYEELEALGLGAAEIPEVLACIKKASWQTGYKWTAAAEAKPGMAGLARGYNRNEAGEYRRPGLGAKTITPDLEAHTRLLFVKGDAKLWPALRGNYKRSAGGDAGATELPKIACNMALVYHKLQLEFGGRVKLPHYGHFTKWLTGYLYKYQEELSEVCLPSFWRATFQPKGGLAAENVSYFGEKWEIDGTPADLRLIDGRHEILMAVDIFSRDLIVEVEKHASALTVARLFRQGILKWGVPEKIVTDRGAIFLSNHIQSACQHMQIDLRPCRGYAGWEKPHVESAFGSMARMLFEALPWYIGHNVAQRQRIREFQQFHEVFYHKKNPVKISCEATAEQLKEVLNHWLEKVYRAETHRFKDCQLGRSELVWERQANSPRRAPRVGQPEYLDMLLAPAFERVFHSGFNWGGVPKPYMPDSAEGWERVQEFQGKKVLFKPSLADISRGTVWERREDGSAGGLLCGVWAEIRGGLSMEEYSKAKSRIERTAKKRHRLAKALTGPLGYDLQLARMPQRQVATAGFGAPEYDGGAYRELKEHDDRAGLRLAPDPVRDRQIGDGAAELANIARQREQALEELKGSPAVKEYAEIITALAKGQRISPEQRQTMKYFKGTDSYRLLEDWFGELKTRAVQERWE